MDEPHGWWKQRREQFLERPLPSSEDAERAILGGILLDSNMIFDAVEILTPEDFYSPTHRKVYAAMVTLFENSQTIDPILIGEELKKEGALESIGGVAMIANLTYGLPQFTDLTDYVKIVKDKSRARELLRNLNDITTETLAEEKNLQMILGMAESHIQSLTDESWFVPFFDVKELFQGSMDAAQKTQETGNPVTGLSTGFDDLDALTAGLHPSDLIIVGARPSMGKTAAAMKIGQNVAFRQGKKVAVFSLEMNKEQLVNRVICSEAGIDSQKFRSGLLNEQEWAHANEAIQFLQQGNLLINDDSTMTVLRVRQRLKRLTLQGNSPDLVIIDYLQLMDAEKAESRQQQLTKISRDLKKLAKELNIPIIALSQLSRAPEHRAANNHRPQIGDLRESGAIEQDADVVILLYREEMYPKPDGSIVGQGQAEVIVAKQRNGPTDTVIVAFDKASTNFTNMNYSY